MAREEQAFDDKLKSLLDASVADEDDETLRRLMAARTRAVAAAGRTGAPRPVLPRWVAGTAVAALVLVTVIVLEPLDGRLKGRDAGLERPFFEGLVTGPPDDRVAELDLLTDPVQLELIEDLEFYQWLDTAGELG